jgi:uncharacterized protein YggE
VVLVKKKFVLLTALAAVFLLGALPVRAADAPTVSVSGAGAVTAAPDMATITLGVTTEANTAAQALSRNNADVEAVLAALRAFDIDEADIRTQWFSIHQRFDWGRDWNEVPRLIGYTVHNSVIVVVRDLDIVGEVLGAAVAAGANASHGVHFSIENAVELYLEALALAAQDARRKADTLARALGSTVTGIVSVSETGGFHAPVAREDWAMEADMAMMPAASPAMDVPVQPGELTVTARVQVVFAIR